MDWAAMTMRIAGMAALTVFIPLTACSFYCFRLPRKEEEYNRILAVLGYRKEGGPAYIPTIKNEYSAFDYVLPVGLATLISLLGSIVLIAGPRFLNLNDVSLILDGPQVISKLDDTALSTKLQGMLIIGMAFVGAYIWSIQNIFRRLSTIDLPPGAYYSVGVRMIFAIFVSLMVYYSFMPLSKAAFVKQALPVLAFLTGMFPQRALHYLQERVRFSPKEEGGKIERLPLSMIQGIEMFQRVRLAEVGIDNAQNLSEANLVELLLRTPFNPKLIIDWIGQARLYLHFKADVLKLHSAGIRTIFDLKSTGEDESRLKALAEESGVPEQRLNLVYDITKKDAGIDNLLEAERKLLGWQAPGRPKKSDPGA